MNARHRNLLAVALCGALAAPVASAQLVGDLGARGKAAISAPVPTRAAERVADRTRDQVARLAERDVEVGAQAEANATAHSEVGQREAWARLDVDADGRISVEEADADAMLGDMFEAVDSDGDGFVSDAEYRAHAQAAHVAEASATGAGHAAAHSAVVARATWADLDSDGDGRISTLEAAVDAGFESGFDDMDADGDGFVSQEEYREEAKEDQVPPR